MEFILIYITMSSKREAVKTAEGLMQDKVIASANIYPIEGMYLWEGEIVRGNECVLIVKTFDRFYDEVKSRVEGKHAYSMPCIAKLDAKANEKYFAWLSRELTP